MSHVGRLQLGHHAYRTATRSVGMPSYHGQTVDVFNDFEQLPGAGWVLTDPASAMSVSPSAKFEGANGMLFNPTSLTPAWDGYDIGSDVNVVRFGFWYNVPTQTQNAGFVLVFVAQDTALNNTCRVYIGDDGATGLYSVAVSNSANDLHKLTGIAPGSWYWITGRIANNGNTEGFWHLRHSDAKPWESALQICWACFYDLFPSKTPEVRL